MSQTLPNTFDEEKQLEKILLFLKKYQWLYKFKNVDIFTKNVLSNFPSEWQNYFNNLPVSELLDLLLGVSKELVPEDLKIFINELQELNVNNKPNAILVTDHLTSVKGFGITPKKLHEITSLAPYIHQVCQETGCDLIVDIGSGVGYLSHLLCINYNYPVLALEASKKLVETGQVIQQKQHPECKNRVVFKEMFVGKSSAGAIEALLQEHFGHARKVCLIGLHACADLSVQVLKLFDHLQRAAALVIMPCCYHRMKVVSAQSEEPQSFQNFPISKMARSLFDKHGAFSYANQQFLRLACQRTLDSYTRMSDDEHKGHSQQCVQRAVLELVASLENCSVRRLKRKSGKSNTTDSDRGFEDYLNNLGKTHELVGEKGVHVTDEAFLLRMHEKWNIHKNDCWQVEVLMGLQAAIQAPCENVILLDRVAFLKEKGLHCCTRKITNDAVSPRCWALISKKSCT